MAKLEDRRFKDVAAHEAIIKKLGENSDKLIVIDERQQVVLRRLDTINGTVSDYNSNRYKWDLACQELLDNKKEHKDFMGMKVFRNISIILGLLITVSTILNIYFSR
jgi:hypothetical protein